ncbi:choline transporter-like protein 1 [Chironomus tepperi]|uniref:choline transporter-like protein 1 n=1 Tax=Chironomus tepperi TaxID=113505 RepID=UPI00391F3989
MWAVRSEESGRKCTNLSSLYFCIGFVVVMFIFVFYSIGNANLNRLTKGYDDCGNVCGQMNDGNPFDNCGAHDKRLLPNLQVDMTKKGNDTIMHYTCVDKCKKDYALIFNRCWKTNGTDNSDTTELSTIFQEISQDLILTWPSIALVCVVAFIFSYILLILFRYAIKYIIWIIYIGFVVLIGAGAIGCWVGYFVGKPETKSGFLIPAILFTIMTILAIILLYWFRKRIRLVAQLFKEASKALIDIPTILFEPVLTFLALMLAFAPFLYFAIIIETSGKLEKGQALDGQFQATYQHNFGVYAARYLNIIAFIWFTQFIFGCQHFVIAGTISKWYFARDKTKLDSPIMKTFHHLVFFHLGSVCLGSLIITVVKIIKMIMNAIKQQARESNNPAAQCIAGCCEWLVEQLEQFLQYLIRNAYIIVAKDGTPFFESGKKAFGLLFRNLMDVIALNNFGDIVLVIGRLFVVGIAGFIGYELMNKPEIKLIFVPMLIAIIFAFLIAHCFVSVFEMTVDTIFICFCEDCEENDGDSKPYYMSEGLMKIMSELKETAGGQFNFGPMVGGNMHA